MTHDFITIDGHLRRMELNLNVQTTACKILGYDYASQLANELQSIIHRRIDVKPNGEVVSVQQELTMQEYDVLSALAFAGLKEGARKQGKLFDLSLEDVQEKIFTDMDNFGKIIGLYVAGVDAEMVPSEDEKKKEATAPVKS